MIGFFEIIDLEVLFYNYLSLLSRLCPDDHSYIPLTYKLGKLGMTNPFQSGLLLCGSRFQEKKHQLFQYEIFLPQDIKQKKSYFGNIKTFKNFEGHDHWHWTHVTFWFITICQCERDNDGKIWTFDAIKGISKSISRSIVF